jgi:hypothetical protein
MCQYGLGRVIKLNIQTFERITSSNGVCEAIVDIGLLASLRTDLRSMDRAMWFAPLKSGRGI